MGSTASSPSLAVSSSSSTSSSSSSPSAPVEQLSCKWNNLRGSAGEGGESSPLISIECANSTYHQVSSAHSCRNMLVSRGGKTTGEIIGRANQRGISVPDCSAGRQACDITDDIIFIKAQGNNSHHHNKPGEQQLSYGSDQVEGEHQQFMPY